MTTLHRNLLTLAMLGFAATAQAAPHRVGDFVFPKAYPAKLTLGQRVVGEVTATDFLTVIEVKGEWLWVERSDIYDTDAKGPKGYIRASEVDSIDQQIAWAETLIGNNPNNPVYYKYAGLVCRLSERTDLLQSGVSYFTRAIQLSPADHDAYKLRGYCWIQLGQVDQVVADLEMAVQLDPTNEFYQEALAHYRQQLDAGQGAQAPIAPATPVRSPGLDKTVATTGVIPAA